MKDAQELSAVVERIYDTVEHGQMKRALDELRAIQRDAIKEGMRRAAQIAEDTTFALGKKTDWEQAYDKGCLDSQSAILAAAEKEEVA